MAGVLPMPIASLPRIVFGLALAAGLGGCANKAAIPPGTMCQITGGHAPFYKYGPAQSFGADEVLPQGTKVTLIERGFGFSRVMRDTGVTGYVSTDDYIPLPPEPKPKVSAGRSVASTGRGANRVYDGPVRHSNVKSTPGDPLFDINDVPLPVKDEPPKPELRAPPPGQRAGSTPAPEKKN